MKPMIVCCFLISASIQSQNATQQDKSATQTQTVPRITVKGDVMKKKLVRKVTPRYPPEARPSRVSGTVVLRVLIGVDGSVEHVEYVSGPKVLLQATIDGVRQYKYNKPTTENGQPVEVDTTVETVFSIVE